MKVIQFGDSILRQSCATLDAEDILSKEAQDCAVKLVSIMKGLKNISPNNGNGLSAPQIGVSIKLTVVFFDEQFNQMFNPHISHKSQDTFEATEGCLSFFYLRAPVSRHQTVTVSFQDQFGKQQEKTFSDNLAALVQHELDHLDGVLFIDRISDNNKISSVDYLLKDKPERLVQVKRMIEYVLE